jgi:hypothetical protein
MPKSIPSLKPKQLIKIIKKNGCEFLREGNGDHIHDKKVKRKNGGFLSTSGVLFTLVVLILPTCRFFDLFLGRQPILRPDIHLLHLTRSVKHYATPSLWVIAED